jgi:hypothetical protein
LRRLFSTFAPGGPGIGLLLLRLTAGTALLAHAYFALRAEISLEMLLPAGGAMAGGVLLIAGLWTPVAGSLAALLALWNAFSRQGDPWAAILLAAIGAGLALLGPGTWSVDARLFGWKRIDLHNDRG